MIERIKELAGGRIVVASGDITEFDGDAIVNAANSSLLGGGGVDGANHRAAGPELLAACKELRATRLSGGLAPGEAVLTPGFRLRARAVIHTVGPVWRGGEADEEATLARAYQSSLALAAREGFHSLAFPAISTGVYGYPPSRAAPVAYRTVLTFLAGSALPETVWLVFFRAQDAGVFLEALGSVLNPPPHGRALRSHTP